MRMINREELIEKIKEEQAIAVRSSGPATGASDSAVNGKLIAYNNVLDLLDYDPEIDGY